MVRVGESGREPVRRALVVADGFNLLPILPFLSFRCSQALVGSAREPTERNTFRANGRLLFADQRGHSRFDLLAAAFTMFAQNRVRKPGDFLLDCFCRPSQGPA